MKEEAKGLKLPANVHIVPAETVVDLVLILTKDTDADA